MHTDPNKRATAEKLLLVRTPSTALDGTFLHPHKPPILGPVAAVSEQLSFSLNLARQCPHLEVGDLRNTTGHRSSTKCFAAYMQAYVVESSFSGGALAVHLLLRQFFASSSFGGEAQPTAASSEVNNVLAARKASNMFPEHCLVVISPQSKATP